MPPAHSTVPGADVLIPAGHKLQMSVSTCQTCVIQLVWKYEPQLNARGRAGVSADAVRAGHIRALERAHRVTVNEPREGIFLPVNLRRRRSVFNRLNAWDNASSTHGVVVVVAKGISEVAVSLSGRLLGYRHDE